MPSREPFSTSGTDHEIGSVLDQTSVTPGRLVRSAYMKSFTSLFCSGEER